MAEVRWLGPYAPEDRHADSETVDHIIALRKQLHMAEHQMNNALDGFLAMKEKERIFRYALHDISSASSEDHVISMVLKAFKDAEQV